MAKRVVLAPALGLWAASKKALARKVASALEGQAPTTTTADDDDDNASQSAFMPGYVTAVHRPPPPLSLGLSEGQPVLCLWSPASVVSQSRTPGD